MMRLGEHNPKLPIFLFGKNKSLEEITYQLNRPIGLDLKLLKRALEDPLKIPLVWPSSVVASGYLRGYFRQLLSPAL